MSPIQISPSVKKDNTQVVVPKPKRRSYTLLLVGLTLILVLLVPVASLVAASYLSTEIPFVPKNIQHRVDSIIASIPLIPKTPKQIITRVFDSNERIRTSNEVFQLSIKSNGQEFSSFKVNSQLDATNLDKPSIAAEIIGEYGLGEQKITLDLSLTEIDKDLYFKINEAPSFSGYNFSQIKSKWFLINLESAGQDIGFSVRGDSDIYSEMTARVDKAGTILVDEVAKKFTKLPDEKVSGESSFHLQVSPTSQTLAKIYNTVYPEQKVDSGDFQKLFKETRVDLWVNKKSFVVNKVEILTRLNSLSADAVGGSFEINFGYQVSDVNKAMEIEAPKNAKKINSFSDLSLLLEGSSTSNLGPVLGIVAKERSFGSDTLFYERLFHVLTLLPSVVK